MPTLYLIDGYAQFFRAYHAIRSPLTSPVTKEPTNMTFGFIGMLLKLLRGDGKHMAGEPGKPPGPEAVGVPEYVAVTIDVSGDRGTFRSQLYPEYKAHRPEIPEAMPVQIERCLAILREIGMPIVGAAEFEADDVIASLVTSLRARHPDLRIRIIAKDKDLKQLLAEAGAEAGTNGPKQPVEMYDVHTDTLIDVAALKAETGLTPAQVIDMLALMGDAVDNVPGVEGVGGKTAAQLVAQYGSIDAILAHAAEIKGKRGENIRAAAPLLDLSRRLVTLRHDAPVSLDLDAASVKRLDLQKLIPICRELGFNRYQDEAKALLSRGGGAATPEREKDDRPMPPGLVPPQRSQRPPAEAGLFAGTSVDPAVSPAAARPVDGEYRAVTTREELALLASSLRAAPAIAIDTETTSLHPRQAKLCGISVTWEAGRAVYVPMRSPTPEKHLDEATVLAALRPILEDETKPKIGHNLKYDMLVLRAAGVSLRGATPPQGMAPEHVAGFPGGDTMVASYLIDASRSSHSKDALCLALLHRHNIPIADLIGSGKHQRSFETVPIELATPYAAEDADVTLQLRDVMLPQLRAMQLTDLWASVEMPLVEVLAELEWNGILVDPDELERQRKRLESRIESLAKQIDRAAMEGVGRTFNPDSPKQLAGALFNAKDHAEEPGLGLKSIKKTKTGHSTDIEVLEKLAADVTTGTPIPGLIVEYRQLTKLVGTYLEALKEAIDPGTKRVHSSFSQTVAATGRLASSDPNLQNIPIRTEIGREIRRAFVAAPGYVLITADYSQIELRLLAHLSRDAGLIEAFQRGEDIHAQVAAQIHGVRVEDVTREQRAGAKMVNFGIVYGITSYGLARRLGVDDKKAAEIIAGYKARFSGITTFLEECVAQAKRFGYVETMLKRRRPILGIDARNPSERSFAERTAINSVVQGSAADLIKIAMVDLHGRLSEHAGHWRGRDKGTKGSRDGGWRPPEIPGVRMLLQIHDELVFEADAAVAESARVLIVERMERAMTIAVPLKVDSHIAATWYDGK
ncbi:MAG: DNA polymerase I [Phycisphaerales bacterium]